MKESQRKAANRSNPESCAGGGNIAGEALTHGTRRPAIELRNHLNRRADLVSRGGRPHGEQRSTRVVLRRRGVRDPEHAWKLYAPGHPHADRRDTLEIPTPGTARRVR